MSWLRTELDWGVGGPIGEEPDFPDNMHDWIVVALLGLAFVFAALWFFKS